MEHYARRGTKRVCTLHHQSYQHEQLWCTGWEGPRQHVWATPCWSQAWVAGGVLGTLLYLRFPSLSAAAAAAAVVRITPFLLANLLLFLLLAVVDGSSSAGKSGRSGSEVAVEAAAGGNLRRSHAPHQLLLTPVVTPAADGAPESSDDVTTRCIGCIGATAVLRAPSSLDLRLFGAALAAEVEAGVYWAPSAIFEKTSNKRKSSGIRHDHRRKSGANPT